MNRFFLLDAESASEPAKLENAAWVKVFAKNRRRGEIAGKLPGIDAPAPSGTFGRRIATVTMLAVSEAGSYPTSAFTRSD
ncbi:hypothetical protein AM571_CH03981 [Rhizobium etli 8C-3]|uniref:Uncharacterized protein n=1 Tax=Rhizobium etli 8C-3 TaxID=538025 RepID=A0A1L5P9I5_RHIET|nr:hypothetical protein AM571_CH03981 [Rhizobium etli 8C-3]